MANQKPVDLLKQGVEQWNAWYSQHGEGHDLSGADLDLLGADLSDGNLLQIDLSDATLSNADLRVVNLRNVSLNNADLSDANLSGATLGGATLGGASLFMTIFANVDLRETKGLVEINHVGPSIDQLHTVQFPQDGSALHFLHGTGVPDEWIALYRAEMMYSIQYHSLFISYSSKDDLLARRLHADLQAKGVRCWFAPEDMKIGDKIRPRIDEAIHLRGKGGSFASSSPRHAT